MSLAEAYPPKWYKRIFFTVLCLAGVTAFSVQKHDVLEQLRNRVISEHAESLTGQELVDYVNRNQAFFKAAPSKFSMESMKAKLMDVKYLAEPEHVEELVIDEAIPDRQALAVSRSCWAFGAAEAMSDRICIASNGKTQVSISADDVLSCCGKTCGDGCNGGYPLQAWKYWEKHGICTGGSYESQSGCKPYPIPPCGHHANETYFGPCPKDEYDTPVCTNTCIAGYPAWKKGSKCGSIPGKSAYGVPKTVEGIQKEIMTNGPVEAAYTVYEDFYQYTGGVYVHTGGQKVGGHAVRILGWGVDNKTPYWLVANSWNTDWGENGYFRIVRGLNECGIEHAIVAGLPK
ncbi:papain family cysteine protease [Ancylostoma ceylanicum]|uniref:Papain family cysteine protease n=1 Tax=Ancylostoma ceylanicum TaxID=53326 RepID=A0A0D6L575_9BILA|nr:papain family cysteine protease [Ancylostoma ceylanicum]